MLSVWEVQLTQVTPYPFGYRVEDKDDYAKVVGK